MLYKNIYVYFSAYGIYTCAFDQFSCRRRGIGNKSVSLLTAYNNNFDWIVQEYIRICGYIVHKHVDPISSAREKARSAFLFFDLQLELDCTRIYIHTACRSYASTVNRTMQIVGSCCVANCKCFDISTCGKANARVCPMWVCERVCVRVCLPLVGPSTSSAIHLAALNACIKSTFKSSGKTRQDSTRRGRMRPVAAPQQIPQCGCSNSNGNSNSDNNNKNNNS